MLLVGTSCLDVLGRRRWAVCECPLVTFFMPGSARPAAQIGTENGSGNYAVRCSRQMCCLCC
jgi:hypothetical protein